MKTNFTNKQAGNKSAKLLLVAVSMIALHQNLSLQAVTISADPRTRPQVVQTTTTTVTTSTTTATTDIRRMYDRMRQVINSLLGGR